MRKILFPAILSAVFTASAFDIDSLSVSIASAGHAVEAAKAQAVAEADALKAANVLEGPEVEFEYKFAPSGALDRWGFSIGQSFDFPGVYAARRKENGLRQSAFAYLYQNELMERTYEVKTALIRLLQARETRRMLADAAENTDLLCEKYREALRRGETTILEVKKMEIQQYEMYGRLAAAKDEEEAAAYALDALCGDDRPALPEGYMYIPELHPFAYYKDAATVQNPALNYYSSLATAEAASVRTARNSAFPSMRLSFIHDFEENTHFNGFGISLSLPTWNNSHNVRAARARAHAAEEVFADNRQRQTAQFSADYAAAERLAKEVERGRSLFADDSYTDYLRRALDAGRITVFTYLTEYTAYLEARIAYIQIQGDFARAEAALSKYQVHL